MRDRNDLRAYSYQGIILKEIFAVGCVQNLNSADPDERAPTCYFAKRDGECNRLMRSAFQVSDCGCRRIVPAIDAYSYSYIAGVDPIDLPDKKSDINLEFLKPIKF